MKEQSSQLRVFLIVGLGLLGFGILCFVGGGRFLDRPDTTLMMGIPFVVAGSVVTLMALVLRPGI